MKNYLLDPAPIEGGITKPDAAVLDTPVIEAGAEAPVPQQPKAAPEAPAAPEKKPLDYEAFARELGLPELKKDVDVKPVVDKPAVKEPVEVEEPVIPKQDQVVFDYTPYTPDEQHLLKRMAVPARQWTASILKERKELNGKVAELSKTVTQLQSGKPQIPQSFYDSPDGYRLTPAFTQLQQDAELAQSVYQHWRQQLINIEAGEDWQDLDIDTKGNLVVSAPKEVTPADKMQLREHFEHAREQLLGIKQRATSLAAEHQKVTNTRQSLIKEQEDKYFPQFKDPKFVGWELANQIKDIFEKQGFGDNPLALMLAKSAAANTLLVQHIKQLTAGAATKDKLAGDRVAAGPGGQRTAIPSGEVKAKTISKADFDAALRD